MVKEWLRGKTVIICGSANGIGKHLVYNLIVQYIKDRLPEKCIVFIVGLGKTYPIIRAHKILNTMHQVLDKNPVVLFYPGNYDEKSLRAFGEVKDQNYYRAFRLD